MGIVFHVCHNYLWCINIDEFTKMTHGFNHVQSDDSKDEWLTPPHIIRALGEFDLDPCAPHISRRPWNTAKRHYTGDDLSSFS